jgi:hypothetical protein
MSNCIFQHGFAVITLSIILVLGCVRMDLDSEDEVPIRELYGLKSESSKSNSSSSPKNMCAVRRVSQSHKLLSELKDNHSVSSSIAFILLFVD